MKPSRGFWGLLARVMSNDYRDSFVVQLGTSLLLSKIGLVGPIGNFVGIFIRGILGLFMEETIFRIDLTLDSLREGMKEKEFNKAASEAYARATSKVYDEAKKNEIRKQYLEIISKFGAVGSGPRN